MWCVQGACNPCISATPPQSCAPLKCQAQTAVTCERCAKAAPPAGCRRISCCGCPLAPVSAAVCGIFKTTGLTRTFLSDCYATCFGAFCTRRGACPVPMPVLPILTGRTCNVIYIPTCGVRLGTPAMSYVNACHGSIANVWCQRNGICL